MPDLLHSFMSQATAKGAKSSALHSLQWTLAILLSFVPICLFANAPEWLLVFIVALVFIVIITLVFAYGYLLVKNPDALRSETFTLSKMAIEKGLIGDSLLGLKDPSLVENDSATRNILVSGQGRDSNK